jgi:long-chain acyl-CoA synthetase
MMPDDTDVVDGVGIPVPDCKVMIVSPNTQVEVPTGTIGEICLQAKSVMMGYLNNPKETASMLQTHKDNKVWLHTGDLGYINDRGYVFYTQRLKRMIISNGYNIYPSQIEKVIERHKDVVSCTVVGVSHPLKVQVPKAFVVIKETTPVTLKLKNEIKKLCEENIAHYAIPASFVYKKSLPTTKMGKVDYQKLEK